LKGNPRNQSLWLCLLTFLTGVGFIAVYLRWDIPAEIEAGRKGAASAQASPASVTSGSPSTPTVSVVAVPAATGDTGPAARDLLLRFGRRFDAERSVEADILTPGANGQFTTAGHFFFAKPGGDFDISRLRVRVDYTGVPITQMVLSEGIVWVYQPSRQFAESRDAESAAEAWLKDFKPLMVNLDLALTDAGDEKTGRAATLSILPRQPGNITKALVSIDLARLLPVRFEAVSPLRNLVVGFGNVKADQPIDPAVFKIALPAGMNWTRP
jgi:hypothetical protein